MDFQLIDRGEYAVLEFDMQNEKVNKLSRNVLEQLDLICDELAQSKYKAVVFISNKKHNFIVGADIKEIQNIQTESECAEILTQAHSILNKWESLKMMKIAVIHGHCLGGGCELILACDYRIASEDALIGLPEVKLGIFPGFGGCVRLPKLVGLGQALNIILTGRVLKAKQALRISLVDEVIPYDILKDQAIVRVNQFLKAKKIFFPKKRQKGFITQFMNVLIESSLGRFFVFRAAKKQLLSKTKGFYPAPLAALNVIQSTFGLSIDKALEIEKNAFCKVVITKEASYLIRLFYLLESVKTQTGVMSEVEPRDILQVGVLGAGTMGGGISYLVADKNKPVRMKDISYNSLGAGFKYAQSLWQKKLKRRRITKYEMQHKMDLISGELGHLGFADKDLIIEAVVEKMDVKKQVIQEMAGVCKRDTIIATNTSSLSVNEMAKAHPFPENFLGLHFFNPVDKMPLVEVIRGEQTSDLAVATVFHFSKQMGKTPIVVKDGPGFLVNRLLLPWLAEALLLFEEGAKIETLDRYFTDIFGMPMGPLRLVDEVGIDVAVKVLKIFRKAYPDRVKISSVVESLEHSKLLGKKGKKGFYIYTRKGEKPNNSLYGAFGIKGGAHAITEKESIERCLFAMINEASRVLLEDQIVKTAAEIDLAMIMGTGFPPFRGGLLRYADDIGISYIVSRLDEFKEQFGARFKAASPLKDMNANGGSFYS